MKEELDIDQWNRKDHFNFFSRFEEPFFGVTVHVDCTNAYRYAKENGISFFLVYLFHSLHAANAIEPFRYRIEDGKVFIHDEVHASPVINRPDGTIGFAYINYSKDFQTYLSDAKIEIDNVRQSKGLIPAIAGENVIHYSSLPWLSFTSVSHARAFSFKDSIPKITFGKMTKDGDGMRMPVSIHVHHALMDGYHVGQYVETFQALMNQGV